MRRTAIFGILLVLLALAAPAAMAEPRLRDNGDGTLTDTATGLTWVGDGAFAVTSGFATSPWLTPAQAAELVRAMNAAELPAFGRHDWRLPTAREAATFQAASGPVRSLAASRVGPRGRARVRPVAGAAVVAGVADCVAIVTNSVRFARDVRVLGNVVANEAVTGPTLEPGFEVFLEGDARVDGNVSGDRVGLGKKAVVVGTVTSNTLTDLGATVGATATPLALPVFSMLPAFQVSAPRDGSEDVTVGSGETRVLGPGDWGVVTVAEEGVLVLTGGLYQVVSIALAEHAALLYEGHLDLRVRDRLAVGHHGQIAPAGGSALDGSAAIVYVGGTDGADGQLGSPPPAASFDQHSRLVANLYVANGTASLGHHTATQGGVIARDLVVDQHSELLLASFFANRPPTARPGAAFTDGAPPIVILLEGSDPEDQDLSFSIVVPPAHGTLSGLTPVVPPDQVRPETGEIFRDAITSALVTYTPATGDDLEDVFTFRVEDPLGLGGTAQVVINPATADGPPPPPPDTVVADDGSETVFEDAPRTLTLTGAAPDGVALSFALVAGSGPQHGSLSPLVAGSEVPQRSATTVYTPDAGHLGPDSFDFTACGTILGVETCDTATVALEVVEVPAEPTDLAPDLEVDAVSNQPLSISLLGGSIGSESSASRRAAPLRRVVAAAAFLQPVTIAGNVADADDDGIGDNHNDLPGPAPGLISAGVDQAGGAGSNGTVRIHMEWDVSSLGDGSSLESADVTLPTHRGTVDSLDTTFWVVGADGNGTLEDADFAGPAEQVLGVVMPVPPLTELAVGEDGTFSFSVLPYLQAVLTAGHDYLVIQGRVDETASGPARGLEVRSTSDGNVTAGQVPALGLATPGVVAPLQVTILTLPLFGTLFDFEGDPITVVPALLDDPRVSYLADSGFIGDDSFEYQVQGAILDTGFVFVRVIAGSCALDPAFCDSGR